MESEVIRLRVSWQAVVQAVHTGVGTRLATDGEAATQMALRYEDDNGEMCGLTALTLEDCLDISSNMVKLFVERARKQRQRDRRLQGCSVRRVEKQFVDVPLIEVVKLNPQERVQEPSVEHATMPIVKSVGVGEVVGGTCEDRASRQNQRRTFEQFADFPVVAEELILKAFPKAFGGADDRSAKDFEQRPGKNAQELKQGPHLAERQGALSRCSRAADNRKQVVDVPKIVFQDGVQQRTFPHL